MGPIQRHAGRLGVRTPCGKEIFCLPRPSRTALGPTLSPVQWTPKPFPGRKAAGAGGGGGAYHSPPSRAEVQSGYSYNSTTPLCLPGVLEDELYLYSLYSFSRYPVTWPTLGSNIHLRNVTTRRKSVHFVDLFNSYSVFLKQIQTKRLTTLYTQRCSLTALLLHTGTSRFHSLVTLIDLYNPWVSAQHTNYGCLLRTPILYVLDTQVSTSVISYYCLHIPLHWMNEWMNANIRGLNVIM